MLRIAHFKSTFFLFFLISIGCSIIAREKKPWTWIVFAAAHNNLRDYAPRNIKQSSAIGSNQNVNIVFHLDICPTGGKKMTRRYFIKKNDAVQIEIPNEKLPMDSGDPQTILSAVRWAAQEYPAEHYALIFWNHGTGIVDPFGRRHIHTDMLYHYNPSTNIYELDRSVGFLDLIEAANDPKGICWDDGTGNYLINQKLEFVLQETVKIIGQKLDIVGFDACLMAMVEIAQITKSYAKIQISSQEVEPAAGWHYDLALTPFLQGNPDPYALAKHVVEAYSKAYRPSPGHAGFVDFTQSALDLSQCDPLEANLDAVGNLLMQAIQSDQAALFKNCIAQARSRKNCTHFNEPAYVDLHHFYTNLDRVLSQVQHHNSSIATTLQARLKEGIGLIRNLVIHSVSGSNLPLAKGVSIFFPERKIHPSYKKCNFATNSWASFLTAYLLSQ